MNTAITIQDAESFLEQGNRFLAKNDFPRALDAYARCLALEPRMAQAHYNSGVAHHLSGDLAKAIPCYQTAIAIFPDLTEAHFNLGHALTDLGQLSKAAAAFGHVLDLNPSHVQAAYSLGNLFKTTGHHDRAVHCYEQALRNNPEYAEAWNNLGIVHRDQGRLDQATACFEKALAIAPEMAQAWFNLGIIRHMQNEYEVSLAHFEEAIKVNPQFAPAHWHHALLLPMLYRCPEEIETSRQRFKACLKKLVENTRLETQAQRSFALEGVASTTNFYLQYQGANDTALQKSYGDFAASVMAANFPQWSNSKAMPPLSRGERLRVGYVSSLLYGHTIGVFLSGWISHHDRRRFELYCYHVGAKTDNLTDQASRNVDHFHHIPGSVQAAARQIDRDNLHVLIHTDVGMNPLTFQLAALRLAPIQCKSWGHPVTTGLPAIDYYLSSELMEPPDGDAHYSETLVRLPNLALCHEPPGELDSTIGRDGFDIPGDRIVFLCAQSLFKYLPQHDDLYPRIALLAPGALFVFIANGNEQVTAFFRSRLENSFNQFGLNAADYCQFVSKQPHARFLDLNHCADVVLDSLVWSGGKSSMEALWCGTPVITLPGEMMRGRHTYAFLKRIGAQQAIASDKDDYIRIAARCATEDEFLKVLKSAVQTGRHLLYHDEDVIIALEGFLDRLVRSASFVHQASRSVSPSGQRPYPDLIAEDHLQSEQDRIVKNSRSCADAATSFDAGFEQADQLFLQGNLKEALSLYKQITEKYSEVAVPWSRMGLIHLQLSQWEPAVACYRKALLRDESQPAYWYNLAQGLEESGNRTQALEAYGRAAALAPRYREAIYNSGRLHLLRGDFAKARDLYQRCVEIDPEHAGSHNNLGKALAGLNLQDQARICFERASELNPELGEAWFNLAEVQAGSDAPDQAIPYYQKAIAVQSDPSAAWNNLGNLHRKLGNLPKAAGCYEKVIGLKNELAEAHYNLGSVLRLMESYEPALTHLAQAVKLKPGYAEAWNNLALTCKNIGELDRALAYFDKAVECQPDLAVARWNRSFIYLLKKDYINAWYDFEWRFRIPDWKTIYPLRPDSPCWDGSPCPRQTILVHDEQGLGDTLQFVRYLPMVKARCGRTILETRPELISLVQGAPGVDQVVIRPKTEREQMACDFHVPLMSLPGIFRTTPETIPSAVPYLSANPVKYRDWAGRLPAGKLRIGLVWAGRPQHTNDHNRSCPLSEFLPLLALPGTRFISLQKGEAAARLHELPPHCKIDDLGGRLHDFSDTAAVVAHLDLVITVDTAVAHLAGAMGKAVWVMIPFIADWRWGAHGQDSPWYPSMRLFRQTSPKDWRTVLTAIEQSLRDLLGLTLQPNPSQTAKQNLSSPFQRK